MEVEVIYSLFLGVGLAAAAGFRVFLPLLALSLGSYFGWVPVSESFGWVGSMPALIALALASILEVAAYYIPWVDNLLDTAAVPLATVAGTGVMAASLVDMHPMMTWGLAIIAGGGTAGMIKSAGAGTRLLSSVKTAGIANPVVSTVETGASMSFIVLAFLLPVLAVIMVVMLFFFIFRMLKRIRGK